MKLNDIIYIKIAKFTNEMTKILEEKLPKYEDALYFFLINQMF